MFCRAAWGSGAAAILALASWRIFCTCGSTGAGVLAAAIFFCAAAMVAAACAWAWRSARRCASTWSIGFGSSTRAAAATATATVSSISPRRRPTGYAAASLARPAFSSALTAASCRRGCRDGSAPPQVEATDGGQDERAECERHRADHELHNDARLPVLPALEKTARQRRAGVLVRAEGVYGSRGAHGAIDGWRAVPAGGGAAVGVSAVVDANAVPRAGLVGRDGDERNDRAGEGAGGRRGTHCRGGAGARRPEYAVHVRAQEQDERGTVG